MHAEFIAVMQIVVYTGAIMVLFIFVIMLLNVASKSRSRQSVHVVKYFGLPLAVLLIVQISLDRVQGLFRIRDFSVRLCAQYERQHAVIGKELYTQYALPFEVTSILLLVAIIGAIVMAKKEI